MAFEKGHKKIGGRKKQADVWQILNRAAEIAAERDKTEQQTGEEFLAQLISSVQKTSPETALKVMAQHTLPKPRFKPLGIRIKVGTPEECLATLQQISRAMANGGDIASLEKLNNSVQTVLDAMAVSAEITLVKLMEEERAKAKQDQAEEDLE